MEFLKQINEQVGSFLWGGFLLYFLLIVGLFLTIGTKALQIRRLPAMFKETLGTLFRKQERKDGVTPFQAMSAALGGTIGTGNITGVATALTLGGAGAIFWMWVSAVFCMVIKFAEVTLAVHFREKNEQGEWSGGPMYYIKNGLGKRWLFLAVLFCFFGVAASFGIGGAAQVNSVSESAFHTFLLPKAVTGFVFMLLVGAVIFGGVKRLTVITSKLVPFMAIFYVIGAFIVIFCNAPRIPSAFTTIFSDAFRFEAGAAGAAGFTISNAIRYGVSRGIFTNEAGMGSAPIIHASAENTPVKQGYWGAFEVFADTIVVCTITALVILSSSFYGTAEKTGPALVQGAFREVFGSYGSWFLTVSLALFAFASIIGWSYYGTKCCEFLFKRKAAVLLYKAVFCVMLFISANTGLELIWGISDTLNGFMALPNLCAVILLSPVLYRLVKEEG
ncbi:MAG: hypothetical protein BGN88_02625 [Clostridiales bacterium 43-6]|nr:MAG: hypothetical protein BGN88_02625 [Clostridiales bacterium 43-6]